MCSSEGFVGCGFAFRSRPDDGGTLLGMAT